MVAAMKAKETVKLASLRAIKAAIMLAKTAEGATGEVSDQEVVKIIQKLVKQRKESAQQYNDAGRPELAENELAEAAVMEVYLPKQLSEAELEAELTKIIAEVGATTPQEMGKVMGVATKKLAGLADGRAISAAVKKLLAYVNINSQQELDSHGPPHYRGPLPFSGANAMESSTCWLLLCLNEYDLTVLGGDSYNGVAFDMTV